MSVTGEFQRYLATLVDQLGRPAASHTETLRAKLEAVRARPHAELAGAASAALEAIEAWRADAAEGESPDHTAAKVQQGCEDLATICRIILGR